MRPLVGMVAALLVMTAVIDVAARFTSLSDEAPHLVVVGGYLLLSLIGRYHDDRAIGLVTMTVEASQREVSQLAAQLQSDVRFPAQTDPDHRHGRATA
jgi:hypothetical protein